VSSIHTVASHVLGVRREVFGHLLSLAVVRLACDMKDVALPPNRMMLCKKNVSIGSGAQKAIYEKIFSGAAGNREFGQNRWKMHENFVFRQEPNSESDASGRTDYLSS